MNVKAIYQAIKARLESDTGTGGLFASGAELVSSVQDYWVMPKQPLPVIVIDIPSIVDMSGFSVDSKTATVRIHTFNSRNPAEVDGTSDILARIYGDSNRTPTYGLHRHTLVVSGGWTATKIIHRNSTSVHEEDVYHFVDEFEFVFSRAAS